jgi:hypothetical protein
MYKGLIHIAARDRARDELVERLLEKAERFASSELAIALFGQLDKDPLSRQPPLRATVELVSQLGASVDPLLEVAQAFSSGLENVAHLDLSSAVFGIEYAIVPCEPTGIFYQYLMRRRVDFSHDAYLKRYLEVHAEFGRRTPGVAGYGQLHVDPEASQLLADAFGCGIWRIDSVSMLHMRSVEEFIAAVSESTIPSESRQDEEAFVDRANSLWFTSERVLETQIS